MPGIGSPKARRMNIAALPGCHRTDPEQQPSAFRQVQYPPIMSLARSVTWEFTKAWGETTPHGVANQRQLFLRATLHRPCPQVDSDQARNHGIYPHAQMKLGRTCCRNRVAMPVKMRSWSHSLHPETVDSVDCCQDSHCGGTWDYLTRNRGFIRATNREMSFPRSEIVQSGDESFFHSSCINRSPLVMEGTIPIAQGMIHAIKGESRHDQPGVDNLEKNRMVPRISRFDCSGIRLTDQAETSNAPLAISSRDNSRQRTDLQADCRYPENRSPGPSTLAWNAATEPMENSGSSYGSPVRLAQWDRCHSLTPTKEPFRIPSEHGDPAAVHSCQPRFNSVCRAHPIDCRPHT